MILGVTGGIGSGKSTVCRIFSLLGVPVYDSDVRARQLSDSDLEIRQRISYEFGKQIYTDKGLNRKRLGEIVFRDKEKLNKLNNIIHPAVFKDFEIWKENHSNQKLLIKEAAILFESGGDKHVDKTLVISAPLELRIKRIMKRDNITREEINQRLQHQWVNEKLIELADSVIYCNEEQLVIPQVINLYGILSGNIIH